MPSHGTMLLEEEKYRLLEAIAIFARKCHGNHSGRSRSECGAMMPCYASLMQNDVLRLCRIDWRSSGRTGLRVPHGCRRRRDSASNVRTSALQMV